MKRVFTSLSGLVVAALMALAGGIVTNTNQSAAFVRMPAQDAAVGVHAVYHNPAALTKLADGFHIQVGNQSIVQSREVESTFAPLNAKLFTGDVNAPLFPTVYAAYKTGKLAFSFGFNPIGGGGGAEYKTGLPSFEVPIASIPALLSSQGVNTTGYSADVYFKGTSTYLGFQAGVSYKINDMVSVFAGARYVTVSNTYEGYIKDIRINPNDARFGVNGSMIPATTFFSNFSTALAGFAASANGAAASAGAIVAGGGGALTLAQAEGAGIITAAQRAQLAGGLVQFGQPSAVVDAMTMQQIQGAYTQYGTEYTAASAQAAGYSMQTKDATVDSKQTGSGITPIIGAHFTLMEDKLNIGFKYEHQTTMDVTNETNDDPVAESQFPNGEKVPNDMPSMFSLGVSYKLTDDFRAAVGFHYYLDKMAKYGKKVGGEYVTNEDLLDQNSMELAVGLEYDVAKNITLSGGWLNTNTSPTLGYQSDLSHTLDTNTISFGASGRITPALTIDLGVMYTMYNDGEKTGLVSPLGDYKEIYRKKATTFGIGVSYAFGGAN